MRSRFRWSDAAIRRALAMRAGDRGQRYEGVSIDTRTLRPGELFVAIVGERFDGHDFLGEAVAAGCGAVVRHSRRYLNSRNQVHLLASLDRRPR